MHSLRFLCVVLTVLFCSFLISSCRQEVTSQEFLKWLDDPDNGLAVTKKSNGFELKVKYLPQQYFISKERLLHADSMTSVQADSLTADYKNNLCFLLHIDNDTDKAPEEADVMFRDIHDYGQYTERIYKYNFDLTEDITLKRGKVSYHPVLTSFENHYGLEGGRNIMIVFSPATNEEEFSDVSDLELVFSDEELGIGTTHFVFNKKDLEHIPEITLY